MSIRAKAVSRSDPETLRIPRGGSSSSPISVRAIAMACASTRKSCFIHNTHAHSAEAVRTEQRSKPSTYA